MAGHSRQIAIIGGGVAGLGVALAGIERGLSVTIYESGKCGAGSSAASLRIMHGGFRYLQSLDMSRVLYSLRAKIELERRYPQHVTELISFMGLSGKKLERSLPVLCAASIYGIMQKVCGDIHRTPRVLSTSSFVSQYSTLRDMVNAQCGVLAWSDGVVNDHDAFITALCEEIARGGGEIVEQQPVISIHDDRDGTVVRTDKAERCFDWVINTTGSAITSTTILPRTVGFNLVLKRRVTDSYGVGFRSATGRLFFVVPRGEYSVLGTGYVPQATPVFKDSPAIQDFIRDAQDTNPGLNLSLDDVKYVEVGSLPASSAKGDAGSLIERSVLRHSAKRVSDFLITKYTTFLFDGRRAIREILSRL